MSSGSITDALEELGFTGLGYRVSRIGDVAHLLVQVDCSKEGDDPFGIGQWMQLIQLLCNHGFEVPPFALNGPLNGRIVLHATKVNIVRNWLIQSDT